MVRIGKGVPYGVCANTSWLSWPTWGFLTQASIWKFEAIKEYVTQVGIFA